MNVLKKVAAGGLSAILCLSLSPIAYAVETSGDEGGGAVLHAAEEASVAEAYAESPSDDESDGSLPADEAESTTDESDQDGVLPDGDGVASDIEEGTYLIRSWLSDSKVVEVVGNSTDNGANVQIYDSVMALSQRFQVVVDDEGYATFVNVRSGKVLDVAGGQAFEGANVQQYEPNGTLAQKWMVTRNADGSCTIASALNRNLVLDVAAASNSNGANVQLYTSNGSPAQKFAPISTEPTVPEPDALEPGAYYLATAQNGSFVVDVPQSSLKDGTDLQMYSKNGTIAQCFLAEVQEDGYVRFTSASTGKSLDVESGNLVNGTPVQQWARTATDSQLWSPQTNDDGTMTFVSCANGLALDVRGGTASNGTALQTYAQNGTVAQRWTLVPVEAVVPDGYYTFVSLLDAGKVIDVPNGSAETGSGIELWSANRTPAQKFRVSNVVVPNGDETVSGVTIQAMTGGQYLTDSPDGGVSLEAKAQDLAGQVWNPEFDPDGGVAFVNAATGKALDVSYGGTYDGCPVGSFEANGTPAQAFRPLSGDPIEPGVYIVKSCADGRVLDVSNGSRSNGANVQAWSDNASGAQAWTVAKEPDGSYRLTNARSKKSLDVTGGASASGTNVQQWAAADVPAQKWNAVVNEDCSITFLSECGGLALDVSAGGGFDGSNVQVYDQNGSAAQKWRLVPTTYVPQDFEDLLGSFTTYSSNTWNGTYNMQRALDCFNGVVLQPGESMSFYGITGRCGAAEGYLPAGVVGGIGYGGGICQASTTIYGAAIRAGFDIVDRQNHSVPSVYVPIGLDAMVSWGSSDLVVRNNTEYPVKFVTYTYDNVLTCEIWGIHPEWWDSIEPVSWYTSSSSAAAERIYYKDGATVRVESLPSSYYW